MIFKRTTVAAADPDTGLTVKKVETTFGDFLTRKLAVNNTFYRMELERIKFDRPLLSSFVQVHHVHYDKKKHLWRVNGRGGDDPIDEAQAHAEKLNRLFTPYLQLTQQQWELLNWQQAETDFLLLARRGMPVVPYYLPLGASLQEWQVRRLDALKVLNKSQELLPVLCLYHDALKAEQILRFEYKEGKLIGIHYYNLKEPSVLANLLLLQELALKQPIGTEVPLIIGFCPTNRYVSTLASASVAYVLTLFGIDVVSYRVMSPEQMFAIEGQEPEKYPYYDSEEGRYNDSEKQVLLHEQELTRTALEQISANEGLAPYQVHLWSNFVRECEDLDVLNNAIINKASRKAIMEKAGWHIVATELLQGKNF